jgi:hypothetical protein
MSVSDAGRIKVGDLLFDNMERIGIVVHIEHYDYCLHNPRQWIIFSDMKLTKIQIVRLRMNWSVLPGKKKK